MLTTQMDAPSKANKFGYDPTGKDASSVPSVALIMDTVESAEFAVQIFVPSKIMSLGKYPQG